MTKRKVQFSEGTKETEDDGRPEPKSRRFKEAEIGDSVHDEDQDQEETEDVDGKWVEVSPHPKIKAMFSCSECARNFGANDSSMKHFHWCDPKHQHGSSPEASSSGTNKKTSSGKRKRKAAVKPKLDEAEQVPKKSLLADVKDIVKDLITSVTPESVHQTERRGADTRKKYTNIEKVRIINEVHNGGKPVDVAYKYGINRSLISKWMSKKDVLLDAIQSSEKKCFDTKNRRKNKYEKLYKELHAQFLAAEAQGVTISYRWIYECAEKIYKDHFPSGGPLPQSFVSNFTKRFNLQYQKKYKQQKNTSEDGEKSAAVRWHSNSRQVPRTDKGKPTDVPLSFTMNYENIQEGASSNETNQSTLQSTQDLAAQENHSLDSDEEDEKKAGEIKVIHSEESETNVLHEDDIEGQEDETIREDDGIAVTPFNLKEEMEEGHFDAQGNYIANKKDENITDGWLDSVDWNKVPNKVLPEKMEEDDQPVDKINPVKLKKEMVAIMKPGENVFKALRRLGGNKKPASSADRWKKKKANVKEQPETDEQKQQKASLLKLTELADNLLTNGDFQIYEKTYEKLSFEIKESESQFADADEETLDEEDDELEAAFKGTTAEEKTTTKEESRKEIDTSSEVHWFYKEKDDEKSEILGPYSSTQMLKWQEKGKFGAGVFCKRANQEGNFYNSRRIDFDLYT